MDNPTTVWEYQLRELITGTSGIIALWVALMLFLFALASRNGRWALLGALLYASTFAIDPKQRTAQLIQSFEQIRYVSQPIIFVLIVLSGIALALCPPLAWKRRLPAGIVLFLVFLLAYDVRQMISGEVGRGGMGLIAHLATYAGLGFGLSRMLRDIRDCHILLRCVVVVAMLFAVVSALHLAIRPIAVLPTGRFQGTLGNAQKAAVYIAPVLLMAFYLLVQPTEPVLWRLAMGCTAGLLIVFLLWTGSRTGILMVVIGVPLLFRLRLGRGALALAVCGVVCVAAIQFLGIELGGNLARLTSTIDDRSLGWQESWQVFLDNPIFGAGKTNSAFHESSYMSAAAVTGLVGVIPLLAGVVLLSFSLMRLQRIRGELGRYVMLADLVTAAVVSFGVSSMFEGTLLGTLANGILMVFISLTLLQFLLDPMTLIAAHAEEAEGDADAPGRSYTDTVRADYEYMQSDY